MNKYSWRVKKKVTIKPEAYGYCIACGKVVPMIRNKQVTRNSDVRFICIKCEGKNV